MSPCILDDAVVSELLAMPEPVVAAVTGALDRDLPNAVQTLRTLIGLPCPRPWQDIGVAAHSARSITSTCGLAAVSSTLRALEESCRQRDDASLRACWNALSATLSPSVAALKSTLTHPTI
jgi:hypothetical protein